MPAVLCVLLISTVVTAALFGGAANGAGSGSANRTPVIGAKGFGGPSAIGWGTYRPNQLFNGGDPSGRILAIVWNRWGEPRAYGQGKGWIFKPEGGYYAHPVDVDLRASDLGHCTPTGPVTYRRLSVRYPTRPRGSLGPWSAWSGSLCSATGS